MDPDFTTYYSASVNYDRKSPRHSLLVPLDLFVPHSSPLTDSLQRRRLPLLKPTQEAGSETVPHANEP